MMNTLSMLSRVALVLRPTGNLSPVLTIQRILIDIQQKLNNGF